MIRLALDTNILAYAEGVGDAERCAGAIELVEDLPAEAVLLPAQTIGELFRILVPFESLFKWKIKTIWLI